MTDFQKLLNRELSLASRHIHESRTRIIHTAEVLFQEVETGVAFYFRDPLTWEEWEGVKVSAYQGQMEMFGFQVKHCFDPKCQVAIEVTP